MIKIRTATITGPADDVEGAVAMLRQAWQDDMGTHTVYAEMVDSEGYCRPVVTCHNDPADPKRDCLLLEEASDCPDYGEEVGDDCEIGGYSVSFGHGHPVPGCAVLQYIEAGGVEAVWWGEGGQHIMQVTLPAKANVTWGDDYPVIHFIPPTVIPTDGEVE